MVSEVALGLITLSIHYALIDLSQPWATTRLRIMLVACIAVLVPCIGQLIKNFLLNVFL